MESSAKSEGQRRAWAKGLHHVHEGTLDALRAGRADWIAKRDANLMTDGTPVIGMRFGRCACGAIEALLLRENADRFVCCECRSACVEAFIAARRIE